MDFKPTWPQVLQDVMSKCWLADPAARPRFRDVAVELSFDSNPVVYAALAQASAGDGADYSTCDDSALEATEYSACDGALIGNDTAEVPQYVESNPAVEYASKPTFRKAAVDVLQAELEALRPHAPTLGYENVPGKSNQNQRQPFTATDGSKGIQRGTETRKQSVYAGFGEDVNSGGGGIQRQNDARQGSVYNGFDLAAEEEV
jgi:hypothetical protein